MTPHKQIDAERNDNIHNMLRDQFRSQSVEDIWFSLVNKNSKLVDLLFYRLVRKVAQAHL
jgi:hypothetical protein